MAVIRVMTTDGFLSEKNMVVRGPLLGEQHSAFVVTREEVVPAKSAGESLTQRKDKSEATKSPGNH